MYLPPNSCGDGVNTYKVFATVHGKQYELYQSWLLYYLLLLFTSCMKLGFSFLSKNGDGIITTAITTLKGHCENLNEAVPPTQNTQ